MSHRFCIFSMSSMFFGLTVTDEKHCIETGKTQDQQVSWFRLTMTKKEYELFGSGQEARYHWIIKNQYEQLCIDFIRPGRSCYSGRFCYSGRPCYSVQGTSQPRQTYPGTEVLALSWHSPAPFQQMVKFKAGVIRQGLLPPTTLDGDHPNESHRHRLAREILQISHTGLLQDFNNWRSINHPQAPRTKEDLDLLLQQYFDTDADNDLSMNSRTNFAKYMLDFYDVANSCSAQKLQCQYCKKHFAKHFLMPMYPKIFHRCDNNTFNFCWGCLQAANGRDHMIHPGPWLNTTQQSEAANTSPVPDLSIVDKA